MVSIYLLLYGILMAVIALVRRMIQRSKEAKEI